MPYYKVGFETGYGGCGDEWYVEADSLKEAEAIAKDRLMEQVGHWAEECTKEEWEENEGE